MKRIYHTWDEWECYPAGFYEERPPKGMTPNDARQKYAEFLSDETAFRDAAHRVITEWTNSCEHYLTNENMNRIAWIGQASACIALGLPSAFRSGFFMLTEQQQDVANQIALDALNEWLTSRGEEPLSMEQAQSKTQPNLY